MGAATFAYSHAGATQAQSRSARLRAGGHLRLYGTPVGKVTKPIGAGCAVTTDNLEHYAPAPVFGTETQAPVWSAPDVTRWQQMTFQGVVRPDGRVGTANHWLIFPLVFCENRNVEQLRDALTRIFHGSR